MLKLLKLATAVALVVAGTAVHAGDVEVLHCWTSGGGDNAAIVLKSRVVSGNPPAAAQIKGPAIQEWASEGVLANLDATATATAKAS